MDKKTAESLAEFIKEMAGKEKRAFMPKISSDEELGKHVTKLLALKRGDKVLFKDEGESRFTTAWIWSEINNKFLVIFRDDENELNMGAIPIGAVVFPDEHQ